jgi:hypothetical protein
MKRVTLLTCGLLCLATGCHDVLSAPPARTPNCLQQGARFAGTWSGVIGDQPVTMQLTATCEPGFTFFGGSDYWRVSGHWQWRDQSGPVSGLPPEPPASTYLTLTQSNVSIVTHDDHVMLIIPYEPLPADAKFSGRAVGRWPKPGDQAQSLVTFDSAAFQFTRN